MSENSTKVKDGDTPPDFTATTPPPAGNEKAKDSPKPKSEPKPRAPRQKPTPRAPSLERQLEDVFATISIAIFATGDEYCANVVATQAKPLAKAWADLASVNDRVRVMLERMMEGSVWGGVIFATAATVIPIAAHHGLLPDKFPMPFSFGIGPPPPPSEEVNKEAKKK